MRVVAIHAFSYQIQEFNNVSSITWSENSVVILGQRVGDATQGTYTLPNSLYMVRIIKN